MLMAEYVRGTVFDNHESRDVSQEKSSGEFQIGSNPVLRTFWVHTRSVAWSEFVAASAEQLQQLHLSRHRKFWQRPKHNNCNYIRETEENRLKRHFRSQIPAMEGGHGSRMVEVDTSCSWFGFDLCSIHNKQCPTKVKMTTNSPESLCLRSG